MAKHTKHSILFSADQEISAVWSQSAESTHADISSPSGLPLVYEPERDFGASSQRGSLLCDAPQRLGCALGKGIRRSWWRRDALCPLALLSKQPVRRPERNIQKIILQRPSIEDAHLPQNQLDASRAGTFCPPQPFHPHFLSSCYTAAHTTSFPEKKPAPFLVRGGKQESRMLLSSPRLQPSCQILTASCSLAGKTLPWHLLLYFQTFLGIHVLPLLKPHSSLKKQSVHLSLE